MSYFSIAINLGETYGATNGGGDDWHTPMALPETQQAGVSEHIIGPGMIMLGANIISTISQFQSLQFLTWRKRLECTCPKAYIDSVETPNIADKIIMITHKTKEDTSIYTLGYCINISTLQYFPPYLFFEVDENFGFLLMENNFDFSLTDETLITIMKSYFPDQYDYFKKYGDYPPPITAKEVLWRLTIKDDQLIKKEALRN